MNVKRPRKENLLEWTDVKVEHCQARLRNVYCIEIVDVPKYFEYNNWFMKDKP
jgi:hypothetical protein